MYFFSSECSLKGLFGAVNLLPTLMHLLMNWVTLIFCVLPLYWFPPIIFQAASTNKITSLRPSAQHSNSVIQLQLNIFFWQGLHVRWAPLTSASFCGYGSK